MTDDNSLLPVSLRPPRRSFHEGISTDSTTDSHGIMYTPLSPIAPDAEDTSKIRKRKTTRSSRRVAKRWVVVALVAGFVLGYYVQLLMFFMHIRLGLTGEILSTHEVSRTAKGTAALVEFTKRIIYVCKKTNWDYIGLIASPHTVLFAHEDVPIPPAIDETLSIVRHSGVDSFLNLHNKTLTLMSHVHRADAQSHLLKQDEEVVMFWPRFYQCMRTCTHIGACYAGDMHVNAEDATNANSYVFATGGSYFIGSDLLACILDGPVTVEVDGFDYGEDKMVGKMIHYKKCTVQYINCKWFNNREIYAPNAVLKMVKQYSVDIKDDTQLLGEAEEYALREFGIPPGNP